MRRRVWYERLVCTCHSELNHCSDFSLLVIGGETGVVPCVCPCHSCKVKSAALLLHPRWDITAVFSEQQITKTFYKKLDLYLDPKHVSH